MKYFRIGFIGSGNVAWHLAQDLEKVGHLIPAISSKNQESAILLANQLYDTQVLENLDFSEVDLDILILAVKDDAISEVVESVIVGLNTIVVHTSGTKSIDILDPLGDDFGVFYPLQTFTKERAVDLSEVPICIESNNSRVQEILFSLGKSLSNKVVFMSSAQRLTLHLAAVFANNFTNHMLFWAQNIMETEDLDFTLLKTLSKETVEKAFELGPEMAQTGPAKRNDSGTMLLHEQIISGNPELQILYKTISSSIRANS